MSLVEIPLSVAYVVMEYSNKINDRVKQNRLSKLEGGRKCYKRFRNQPLIDIYLEYVRE